MLSLYPDQCVAYVSDPRWGIQTRLKWPPSAAEVRTACEAYMTPVREKRAQERKIAETQRLLAGTSEPRPQRLTYEQLKEKYGETYGLGKPDKFMAPRPVFEVMPLSDLKAHYDRYEIGGKEREVSE